MLSVGVQTWGADVPALERYWQAADDLGYALDLLPVAVVQVCSRPGSDGQRDGCNDEVLHHLFPFQIASPFSTVRPPK